MAAIQSGVPWTSGTDDNTTALAAANQAEEDLVTGPSEGSVLGVEHGATAGTARPDYDGIVLWSGTVNPDNAVDGDVVVTS